MHRSGWRVCREVTKDAYILLVSFVFVCIPSFHFRISVLIAFGTSLVQNRRVTEDMRPAANRSEQDNPRNMAQWVREWVSKWVSSEFGGYEKKRQLLWYNSSQITLTVNAYLRASSFILNVYRSIYLTMHLRRISPLLMFWVVGLLIHHFIH
jgi:hypothetical protein